MPRVLVCGDDQLTNLRIGRVLSVRNIPFDIEKGQIRKDDLVHYDLVVVHSSCKVPHLSGFIENLVLSDRMPVVYLASEFAIGAIRPLLDQPLFAFVDDQRIDAELGIAAALLLKTSTALKSAAAQAEKAVHRADLRRMMDECKKQLSDRGMSEADAHSLILRTAMDRQISKYDACAFLIAQKKSETD
ncbi:MAG: hypothetical protein WC509_02645 [Candidatus Izemoplasmatales bacterium]